MSSALETLRATVRREVAVVADPTIRRALETVLERIVPPLAVEALEAQQRLAKAQAEVERLRGQLHHPHRERAALN